METSPCKLGLAMQLAMVKSTLQKQLDRTLSTHGIGVNELLILHRLASSPSKSLSRIQLAESLSVTASAITKLLLPMEKLHLIHKEKNARDARVSLVALSEAGEQVYQDALVTAQNELEYYFARLTADELITLNQLLNKI